MAVQLILQRTGGGTINLYNKNAATLSTVIRAEQKQSLLGEDIVSITVESAVKIPFSIGDKTTIFGRDYKINRLPKPKKTGNRLFTYDIELEGVQYDLMRATYDLNIDTTSNELQDVQADTLTGDLERFATVLIANANRVFPGKWALGDFPDDTEDKTLTFGETDNCLSVLQRLCQEYGTEFDIEQAEGVNTINFGKAGQIFPYTFEYGKGKGLYELERQNVSSANIVTRLKVFGGTRNVTYKYRANRLCLPGKTKGQSYIEKPDAIEKYGIWEATKHFDNIYPSRTGAITGLVSGSVLKFVDNTMNFDLNEKESDGITTKYLLDGVAAKIHFNSGNLSGFEFELQAYDHATKTFTLKIFKDERDETYPSEKSEAFQFAASDKYVILDIALPPTYIDEAEARLAADGDIYYDQNSQPRVQYSLAVAEEFLKSLSGVGGTANIFQIGDYLPVKDADIDVDKSVRIQGFTRDLIDEYKYQLTISDTVTTNITNRVISELIDIDKVIKINNLKDPAKARRDWRSAQELLDMIFDVEGDYYSEKIKPGSIETQMLSVGAKSTQFGLVGTVIQANYNGNKNSVNVKGGVLTHYAIEEDGRIWNLADNTTTLTGDSTPYYIYAKCQRAGTAGSIIFSTEQIKIEQDSDFYHFFVGVVNSVDPGLSVRSVALTYGFTTVNGRFVRTGRIQSNDGTTYFDLDTGTIGGRIKFLSSGSETDLEDWAEDIAGDIQDTQQAASDADQKAQQAIDAASANVTDYNAKFAQVQQQIDGEISNWFYAYSPTLSNYPASDWTTTTEKDRHIGDTFTNMQPSPAPDAGKSWRFVKNGSVYSWTLIADSDAVKALQQAALAQATADGKSTTFLVQPSNYHLGDTWVLNADRTVNGTAYKQGEILTATQDSTTFVEAHWIKRVRYTDDTAVDNLEIGGRNIFAASKSGLSEITSSEEFTTNMWAANVLPNSYVKIAFLPATSYIMSYEVEIIEKFERASLTQAHAQFALYNGTTLINMGSITHSQYENSVVGDKFLVRRIFTTPSDLSGYYVIGYATRYNDPVANVLMTFRNVQIEKGNKVTDWSPAPEDVQASISDAKQAGMDAQSSAIAAQNAVDDLDEYMGGAFKDGVVSEAEAKAIEKYLNTLNETMSKTEASYNKVYANTYLEGAAKTALLNAKINLWGQRDTLTSAINTAIAGGSTTPAQKTAVDNAFATFNSLMSAFQNALEEANKAIQTKLDNIAKGYVDDLQIGGRNYYSLQNIIANGDFRDKIFTLEPDTEYMAQATIPRPSPALMDCWAASGNSPSRNSATNGVASDAPRKVTSDANGNIWVSFRGTHYDNVINGTYKIWVTKGNKAVDWSEAQEDVQLKITEAKQVGEAAQTAAGTAQATANSLKNFTDTAFADGIVNRSERVAIEKYLNSVNETKLTVDSSYTQVYSNAYLSGTPKTNLQTAKTALNTAYTNLVNSINTAISDNVATPAEKADVDAKYGLFNTALATYQVRLEEANNAIGKGRIDDLDYIGVNLFSDMSTSRIAAWINTSNVIAAASDSYLIAIPVQPNSVYTLSADLQGSTLCRTGYITGSTVIGSTVLSSNRDTVLPRTINTGANATYVVIQVSTSYGAAIKRTVKLEKGTRATPWVANQMDAIISKAITDKFGTTIDGGLVSAVMLVLRALDSQTVTAGISGIQGANRDNPAFWAGGTYDKAFALIQFLSKMSAGTTPVSDEYNNLAKVTILHDGAAKVGDFIILKTGEIVMIDPATGGERLKFNVENLPPIASLVSGVTDGGGPVNIGAGTISYPNNQIALSGSLNVGRDGSVLTYNASQLRVEVHRSTGMASGTARLVLYRDGSPHMELSFVTISVSSGESDARDVTVSRSIPVSAGTYTLRLEFGFDVNTVYGYASVTAGTMSWSYSAAGVRRQQYGLNGMMFFYSNHHFHFTEGGGLDGRALPDKWNTPGVLLSATVASGGGWSDVWGSKQSSTPASKNSSGRYTVYHTIGHAKYQVSASSLVANRSYHIVSQSATNFVIEWRTIGSSPALIDTTFHIQVTGNNYNT